MLEMEKRLSNSDLGFDLPHDDAEDDSGLHTAFAPAAYLTHDDKSPEAQVEESDWQTHQSKQLQTAISNLDERSQDIIAQRWLSENKTTLQELAQKYNVSAERVRQLENNAMKKLKAAVDGQS